MNPQPFWLDAHVRECPNCAEIPGLMPCHCGGSGVVRECDECKGGGTVEQKGLDGSAERISCFECSGHGVVGLLSTVECPKDWTDPRIAHHIRVMLKSDEHPAICECVGSSRIPNPALVPAFEVISGSEKAVCGPAHRWRKHHDGKWSPLFDALDDAIADALVTLEHVVVARMMGGTWEACLASELRATRPGAKAMPRTFIGSTHTEAVMNAWRTREEGR